MTDLVECPFCNGRRYGFHQIAIGRHYIACLKCEAHGPIQFTEKEAIDAWNTRASPWISVSERLPELEAHYDV